MREREREREHFRCIYSLDYMTINNIHKQEEYSIIMQCLYMQQRPREIDT